MTLNAARKEMARVIKGPLPKDANVVHHELEPSSTLGRPRITIEVQQVLYYRTIGVCSKAEVNGVIRVLVPNPQNGETASDWLDEYLDPYANTSIVAALMSAAAESPPLNGTVDALLVTESNRIGIDEAEIPFLFYTTRPAV